MIGHKEMKLISHIYDELDNLPQKFKRYFHITADDFVVDPVVAVADKISRRTRYLLQKIASLFYS